MLCPIYMFADPSSEILGVLHTVSPLRINLKCHLEVISHVTNFQGGNLSLKNPKIFCLWMKLLPAGAQQFQRLPWQKYEVCLRQELTLFSTVLPSNSRLFLSCRPFVVITTFSTGLVGVTKGLQDRNELLLDGRTVGKKGKLILTEIFPSVQKHDI